MTKEQMTRPLGLLPHKDCHTADFDRETKGDAKKKRFWSKDEGTEKTTGDFERKKRRYRKLNKILGSKNAGTETKTGEVR